MRIRKTVLLGLIAAFLFVFASPIRSQDVLTFKEAFVNYQASREDYLEKHEEYQLRKAQYEKFGTQKSQTDAKEATVAMLQARDQVIIDYLIALQERLEETPGVNEEVYTMLNSKIQEELAWFEEHRDRISSAGTLDDLQKDSDTARVRHRTMAEPIYYEVLSYLGYAKVNDLQTRMEEVVRSMEEKAQEIRDDEREGYSFSNRKIQTIDRWMLEIQNLLVRSEEKQIQAEESIEKIADKRGSGTLYFSYNDVLEILGESQQFLKEAGSFLQEVLREIKTAER